VDDYRCRSQVPSEYAHRRLIWYLSPRWARSPLYQWRAAVCLDPCCPRQPDDFTQKKAYWSYGLYGPVAGNPACIRWLNTVGLKTWIIEAPPLHVLASGVPVPASATRRTDCIVTSHQPNCYTVLCQHYRLSFLTVTSKAIDQAHRKALPASHGL
jgi:hypothetical protein